MIDMEKLDEHGLENILSEPTDATKETLAKLNGDIIVLGAGGKMGPTLALMLKKAAPDKTIYAFSRFSDPAARSSLEQAQIKTIALDLLDETEYHQLPQLENVYYLAGMKFGASGNQPLTWAQNVFLPGLVARYYKNAKIVALSTGNVYPFTDVNSTGPNEETPPAPLGEYAQSCLGRERIMQYFSQANHTPMTIIRLNYANEPRYGIIVDLTTRILNDDPIDLAMGTVNLIWQRDANDYIVRSISLAKSPPDILNVTGPRNISVRRLAEQIGQLLSKEPKFVGQESPTALLSDAAKCFRQFGPAQMPLEEMVSHIVSWVTAGKLTLNKPTKYDVRDGKF